MKIRPSRTAALAALLVLALSAFATTLLLQSTKAPDLETPWTALVPDAPAISLTEASKILSTARAGTMRAAIYGSDLYIDRSYDPAAPFEADLRQEPAASFSNRLADAETAASSGPEPDARVPTAEAPTSETAQVVKARLPMSDAFLNQLIGDSQVTIEVFRKPAGIDWMQMTLSLLPAFLMIGVLVFFLGGRGMKGLGLSAPYTLVRPDMLEGGFEMVAGIDKARAELQEIVDFLRDPKAAARLGGKMPKGALLIGPPGGGKTLLARALAKEANVPFLTIQASSVNQIFVGAGARNIRKAFEMARKKAPCIVFIDEIDGVGRKRGSSANGGSDEKETTLNQLLVELDGFDPRQGIFLVAATNRPDVLDEALTRRGRIDRQVVLTLPDRKDRAAILKVHFGKTTCAPDLDIDAVADMTFGFSGSDCAALANEAALAATRAGAASVTMTHVAMARDRMALGIDSDRVLSEEDRDLVAVHEAGHTMVALRLEHADPIEKATILPRGAALGMLVQQPNSDRPFESVSRIEARLMVLAAGRQAEDLVFGRNRVTTGAASDIQEVTRIVKAMVTEWGLSDQGFLRLNAGDAMVVDPNNPPAASIRRIVDDIVARTRAMLEADQVALQALRHALLEQNTLDRSEIIAVVAAADAARDAA